MCPVQTRYKPIAIVAVLLGALGVGGYLSPGSTEEMPTRLLFENAGGKVVFTHKVHAEKYQIPCQQCHHESDQPSTKPLPCGSCHPATFEEGFIAGHQQGMDQQYCNRCHHAELSELKFDHEEHKDYVGGCTDCHHDSSIEPEPSACSDCHQEEGDESMPSLMDATHKRCADCHADMFEQKLEGCENCHGMEKGGSMYPSCSSCHYESKDIPLAARMEAYHVGCMQCHKEKGAGPHTPQDCNKCHFR
jgi:hypothetical protein